MLLQCRLCWSRTPLCEVSLWHYDVVAVFIVDLLVLCVGFLRHVSMERLRASQISYVLDDLDIDILGLDDRVGGWLVQAEGVVVVQLPSLGLFCFVLYHGTRALALLACCTVFERRDVMAIADL